MLVGIQWSGKWTQARKILEKYGDEFVLFEMGGELRRFIQWDSPLAQESKKLMDAGFKATTAAIIEMTKIFLSKHSNQRIIMDGVIRSKEQDEAIWHLFGKFDVLYFDLDEETAVKRLCGRRIDPETQETFPASFTGDTNPKTGNKLITRADDTEDAIRKRIAWSISDTLPLLDIWKKNGHRVFDIDAKQSEEDIFREVEDALLQKDLPLGYTFQIEKKVIHISPEKEKALFVAEKIRPDLVYHTASLEWNPYTFPEVKTLLDGITVGGRSLSDTEQVLRIDRAWSEVITRVQEKRFVFDKATACTLQSIIAEKEALKIGVFRDGKVYISGTTYEPPDHAMLDDIFEGGRQYLENIPDLVFRAFLLFLWMSRVQFFYDGNKRTARMMTNGILLSAGYPPLHILARDQLAYNTHMTNFYTSGDADAVLDWLISYYAVMAKEMGF